MAKAKHGPGLEWSSSITQIHAGLLLA